MLTPDFKRYLYATDVYDWSAMVFDISTNSTTRRPLERAHKEWNPFQPRDRIKFAAPPADLVIVQHDQPAISPVTGVAPTGVLCNPNPNAVTCIPSATYCDLGTSYRTSPDYTTGAGPLKLRGEFAFAALTNGKVAVIDIADFDAPCRAPATPTPLAGCNAQGGGALATSLEVSCNVVAPYEARDNTFEAVGNQPGNHVPGIQTFPRLFANDGSVFGETTTSTPPQMVATLPPTIPAACLQACDPLVCGISCDTLPGCPLETFVGGVQTPIDIAGGQCSKPCQDGTACSSSGDCCGTSVCGSQGVCHPANCAADRTACTPSAAAGPTDPNCNGALCEDCAPDGMTACNPSTLKPNQTDPGCNPALCTSATWAKPSVNAVLVPGAIQGDNGLAMNLEDPRAQVVDQNWAVSFEGPIPGFDQRIAALELPAGGMVKVPTLVDPNSRFCDNGVLSKAAFVEMLGAKNESASLASDYADYVQITTDIPNPEDPYWTELAALDGGATVGCNYAECLNVFGPIDAPDLNTSRDLRILEAYEDHVELEVRAKGTVTCNHATCPPAASAGAGAVPLPRRGAQHRRRGPQHVRPHARRDQVLLPLGAHLRGAHGQSVERGRRPERLLPPRRRGRHHRRLPQRVRPGVRPPQRAPRGDGPVPDPRADLRPRLGPDEPGLHRPEPLVHQPDVPLRDRHRPAEVRARHGLRAHGAPRPLRHDPGHLPPVGEVRARHGLHALAAPRASVRREHDAVLRRDAAPLRSGERATSPSPSRQPPRATPSSASPPTARSCRCSSPSRPTGRRRSSRSRSRTWAPPPRSRSATDPSTGSSS